MPQACYAALVLQSPFAENRADSSDNVSAQLYSVYEVGRCEDR